jgi:hypothetical protein
MPVLRQPGTVWAREQPADSPAEAAQATVHIHRVAPRSRRLGPDYIPRPPQTLPPPDARDPAGDQATIPDIAGEQRHSYGCIWDE